MDILSCQEDVLVTGGTGMVGRALQKVMPDAHYLSTKDCNLTKYSEVERIFEYYKPKYVIHLAAKVSGMKGNMDALGTHFTQNILMNTNIIDISQKFGVEKLLSTLSTCVYPDKAEYPLKEETIHNGEPHWINMGYGYSKRMIDVQSRAYRNQYGCNFVNIIPNNLFGKHDNFHLTESHVIPSVIRKVFEAKRKNEPVKLWGNGKSLREFTFSDDLAKVIIFAFNNLNEEHPMNVGNPNEYSIAAIADMVCELLDHNIEVIWDDTVGNGQFRKPSDNSKFVELGWKNENYTDFKEAMRETCDWFLENYPKVRGVK